MDMKNREIKFRFWDVESKIMDYFNRDNYCYFQEALDDPESYKVMQYTGRKDKSGKEIYEGDLFIDNCHTYLVYWNENACGFKIKIIGGGKMTPPKYNNLEGVIKNIPISGNIHEN